MENEGDDFEGEDDEDESAIASIPSKRCASSTRTAGPSKKIKHASVSDNSEQLQTVACAQSGTVQPQRTIKPKLRVANPL
jgi:hypothetical protein